MYRYRAEIISILDGDTVELKIDMGFNCFHVERIRLLGIDAPETRTKNLEEKRRGLEIKMKLELLLRQYKTVFVETSKDTTFNRWLGNIYLDKDFIINVNQMILEWMNEQGTVAADPGH